MEPEPAIILAGSPDSIFLLLLADGTLLVKGPTGSAAAHRAVKRLTGTTVPEGESLVQAVPRHLLAEAAAIQAYISHRPPEELSWELVTLSGGRQVRRLSLEDVRAALEQNAGQL
jgi:hypothetical protein